MKSFLTRPMVLRCSVNNRMINHMKDLDIFIFIHNVFKCATCKNNISIIENHIIIGKSSKKRILGYLRVILTESTQKKHNQKSEKNKIGRDTIRENFLLLF